MEELAEEIFGTRDYQTILEILPPYDGAVKTFFARAKELGKGDGNGEKTTNEQ